MRFQDCLTFAHRQTGWRLASKLVKPRLWRRFVCPLFAGCFDTISGTRKLLARAVTGDKERVREGGFEPPIPVGNQILNLARLPVPPLSLSSSILAVPAKPLKRLSSLPTIQCVNGSHPRLT